MFGRVLALALVAVALLPAAQGQGSECSGPSANPNSFTLGPDAGSRSVLIFGPGGCSYGVTTTEEWLHVPVSEVATSDTEAQTLTFTFDAYTGDYVRNGRVSIYDYNGYAGASVFVSQSARASGDGSDHSGDSLEGEERSRLHNSETPGIETAFAIVGLAIVAAIARKR
ncbi:MAG TPA: hypothetical protein VM681_10960 [Candidatus Thermoplasmatota archaeon]|nr:hypothetical protein [Candidatus Thermoplasmatota archaeon]